MFTYLHMARPYTVKPLGDNRYGFAQLRAMNISTSLIYPKKKISIKSGRCLRRFDYIKTIKDLSHLCNLVFYAQSTSAVMSG